MIKAALFDVYGTCVDWRSGVARFAAPMLAKKSLPDHLAFEIADRWRALYDPAMDQVRQGKRAYVPLDIIQAENLNVVLETLCIADHFNAQERQELNTAWDALPAWDDTLHCLVALKAHMPIAACSNGSKAMMGRLAASSGLPWTMICGADTAQNFKPHKSVYLQSCDALGTAPEETIMIACHPNDLDAAASFGLNTGYFPRPSEHGSNKFAPEPDQARFTYAAETMTHLIGAISADGD